MSRVPTGRLRNGRGVRLGTKLAHVGGCLEAFGLPSRRLILRYEVLGGAGHAVVVGPTIDHR
jgi:hypothetical protein